MEKQGGITKETLLNLKEKLRDGVLPQWVLADRDLYELEIKKIFGQTWQFLAHESELIEPGSFVTRWIAHDPVLVTKSKSGEIKAFLNSCTHRGTLLCTADSGNQKSFTCPFHGWTYNNEGNLVGIAVGNKVYGEEMNKEDWNLRPIPKVASYQGMIFGTLNKDAESLDEYLGNMKWYLDMMMGRSDGGMEVLGSPQRYVVEANWKVTAENFESDPYHVQFTHKSSKELGIAPNDPFFPGHGYQVVLDNGHGINLVQLDEEGSSPLPYQGMPESMWPMFERNLTKGQLDLLKNTFFVGGVYPNLGFLQFSFPPLEGEPGLYNFLNFRIWRPLAPDKVEVWSWCLIDKAAPEDYKEKSYYAFLSTFGPSGMLEQDDAEIWSRVAQASRGQMAQDKELSYNNFLNYLMGLDRVQPDESFPGPGVAYPLCFLDTLSRSMHKRWIDLLLQEKDVKEEVR
ncbi:SRPBCC family protein [Bacillus sp. B15-48]|uniref:aromatic ring-hydroxylating oxygenase subunit alpha n=1 Tax=Bacillus sp. B15-48 TaxID=1548601 RepID=UPI00193F2827|nr:SRPBCC family protein [Bacillus sp. B15-48]MBM4765160.1 Rieske 2Fe-2S domain-containing protein [Bacillus sp. B15-48]